MAWLENAWLVWLELAPWLLLGAAVAAVLHVMLPPSFIARQLTGRSGVLKAVVLGVPMPLCSCGVIPAALGLRKQGASHGSAVGFLISTPQTGVDSILVSASFLGWPFAVFKVGSAALLGVLGGFLADSVAGSNPGRGVDPTPTTPTAPTTPHHRRARDGWDHGVMLLRTIWHWVLFGVLVSAALATWIPPDSFPRFTGAGGILAMVAMLAISVPLYVCATASVPIAAALVATGFPTGAALVFLVAGPATNLATIGAIQRAFGPRVLLAYLFTIIAGSVIFGMAFDAVLDTAVASVAISHAHGTASWWAVASGLGLAGAFLWFAVDDVRTWVRRHGNRPAAEAVVIPVAGMTCNGCVRKLEGRLRETRGVRGVAVSLNPGAARIEGAATRDALCRVIRAAGYVPDPPAS